MWPDEIRRTVDAYPHPAVTFEGDLDGEIALIRIMRDIYRPSLTASMRDPETKFLNVVKIAAVTVRGATLMYDIFRQTMQEVDASVSRYELTNLLGAEWHDLRCISRGDKHAWLSRRAATYSAR
jgi:hypothetical protein